MSTRRTTSVIALAAGLAIGLPAASAVAAPVADASASASAHASTSASASASAKPAAPSGVAVPRGGTVTGPSPVPAPSADLPAGEVCAFPVHLEFPVNRQQGWTTTDATGRTVAEYVQGTLVGVITRTDTGRSVTRDLSGQGLFTYAADGSSAATGHGAALFGFHTGDAPSNRLLITAPRGFARVTFAVDGHRTLVFGTGEDLCRTLA